MDAFKRLFARLDRFTIGLALSVLMGLLWPCTGEREQVFKSATTLAIMLLFFLYGVKLSRESVIAGLLNWRLQGITAFFTFIFFPLMALGLRPVLEPFVTPELYTGLIFVSVLPSTVQSSIAFTSIAGGNVPAAVCSASVSSLLGVFATPLLVGVVLSATGNAPEMGMDTLLQICNLILFPFLVGQFVRRWLKEWVIRRKTLISWTDQSTIWLVVYTSFSEAAMQGLWGRLPLWSLVGVVFSCAVFLAIVLSATYWFSRKLRFPREDCITIVFCGSKKSLATGVPMMGVIFASTSFDMGTMVIPLILFHQIQLMTCAALARRWRREGDDAPARK